jgi:hypothetical protein
MPPFPIILLQPERSWPKKCIIMQKGQNLFNKKPQAWQPTHSSLPNEKEHYTNLFVFGWRPIASCSTLPPSLSLMDRFLGFCPPLARSAYISVVTHTHLSSCGPPLHQIHLENWKNNHPKPILQLQFQASATLLWVSCSF